MRFLYERQTRRFYLFLTAVCVLQVCILGVLGIFQAQNIRKILVNRELAAVSYLLDSGIPPESVASAWNHTEVTEEAVRLLRATGHTEQTPGYLLLLIEQTSVPVMVILLSAGAVFSGIILTGTAVYLKRREQVYEDADKVIARYAGGYFGTHLPAGCPGDRTYSLPAGETGTIYQLFGSIEQLAQSLQAKSEMEQKAKVFLRDMISDISHQLKTPLAALSMYMEIMMEEPGNEEAVRTFSQKSVQSLERMEQLIRSLLKMARLDTGNIIFERQKCLISELVEQAAEDLMERAKRENKEILTEGRADETIICDKEWTKEAVGNLVKNSLDHTEEGGIIRISWETSLAVARLSVEDDGCGIAEEDIHHIFKQFYRSKSSGARQGAGLGLSLARSIVEGQGGNLSVESRYGEGSIFRMTFLIPY